MVSLFLLKKIIREEKFVTLYTFKFLGFFFFFFFFEERRPYFRE
jgi:hypothetical protein